MTVKPDAGNLQVKDADQEPTSSSGQADSGVKPDKTADSSNGSEGGLTNSIESDKSAEKAEAKTSSASENSSTKSGPSNSEASDKGGSKKTSSPISRGRNSRKERYSESSSASKPGSSSEDKNREELASAKSLEDFDRIKTKQQKNESRQSLKNLS